MVGTSVKKNPILNPTLKLTLALILTLIKEIKIANECPLFILIDCTGARNVTSTSTLSQRSLWLTYFLLKDISLLYIKTSKICLVIRALFREKSANYADSHFFGIYKKESLILSNSIHL